MSPWRLATYSFGVASTGGCHAPMHGMTGHGAADGHVAWTGYVVGRVWRTCHVPPAEPGHDKHDTRVVCECEALPWVPADITPRYLRGAAASRHLAKQGTE